MARYVLLAFDSNKDAEDFVEAFVTEGGLFFMGRDTHFHNIDVDKTFVRGLWAKPTDFCSCTKPSGLSRGAKFGWYVCNGCKKAHPGWAAGEHFYQSLGVNLLPVSAQAPEWRGSGVAHHRFDQDTQTWVHVVTGETFNPDKHFKEKRGQVHRP